MSAGYAEHHHGPQKGFKRWLLTTNHKDIGTMYLTLGFIMFFVGGILAMGIRAELFKPGFNILEPELFNQFTTMHGLTIIVLLK